MREERRKRETERQNLTRKAFRENEMQEKCLAFAQHKPEKRKL